MRDSIDSTCTNNPAIALEAVLARHNVTYARAAAVRRKQELHRPAVCN